MKEHGHWLLVLYQGQNGSMQLHVTFVIELLGQHCTAIIAGDVGIPTAILIRITFINCLTWDMIEMCEKEFVEDARLYSTREISKRELL
jgi:hypothetical protein